MATFKMVMLGGTLALCAGLLACESTEDRGNETTTVEGDSNQGASEDIGVGTEPQIDTTASGCEGIDFLFVIDNSGSMEQEQSNLLYNFPKVVEVLDNYKTPGGAKLTYRLGVTTTGVTRQFSTKSALGPTPVSPDMPVEDGRLLGKGSCGLAQPWVDGPANDLASDFSCMADVGISGWGFEMPLLAMQMALGQQSAQGKPNYGFYEKDKDKLLVVVVLTDEDDCSVNNKAKVALDPIAADPGGGSVDRCDESKSEGMIPVEDVKGFLDELTGGDGRYVFVGIAGPKACESNSPRVCESTFGSAYWAKRVEELVDLCGAYGFLGDIGSGDLWSSLEQALDVVMATCDAFRPI
ncbi:MAG: hypothetical protein MUC50_22595 [Myxococcota bacterium]|jgi:hypothetical protein|nr:hypothetical protein [Myxococcota bacterium]